MHLLEVKNLHVEVDDKQILKGLDLSIGKGSVHAIMGPNGSGKSTLAHVLAGKPGYVVTQGEVLLDGEDILALPPNESAAKGLRSNIRSKFPASRRSRFCARRSTRSASSGANPSSWCLH